MHFPPLWDVYSRTDLVQCLEKMSIIMVSLGLVLVQYSLSKMFLFPIKPTQCRTSSTHSVIPWSNLFSFIKNGSFFSLLVRLDQSVLYCLHDCKHGSLDQVWDHNCTYCVTTPPDTSLARRNVTEQSVQQAVELVFHSSKSWVQLLTLLLISNTSIADPPHSLFPSDKQL